MADKRRGLGRGIGALIPADQQEQKNRPIDVFFGQASADEPRATTVTAASWPGNEAVEVSSTATTTPTAKARTRKATDAKSRTPKASSGKQSRNATSLSQAQPSTEKPSAEIELVPVPGATFGELKVSEIVPNTKQPRQVFDEDDLQELADSIKEVGVLQPIVVRPLNAPLPDQPEARYELIMGERRWRASQLAGNTTVPAVVRRTEDADLLRDALLENLHRAQLNALEESAAYQQLLEDFNITQEELSKRIARSRPQISNTLRLLKLPALVQRRVAAGVLSAGHARALLALPDPAAMETLAQRIVAEGLSVRAVEEIVALGGEQPTKHERGKRVSLYEAELAEVSETLADRFNTKVKVSMGSRRGRIVIDFAGIDDLNRILHTIGEKGMA